MFKEDCPHYQSREDILKNDRVTRLPENPNLHWCGDKAEWIEKCDDPCKRYDLLKKDMEENPILSKYISKAENKV